MKHQLFSRAPSVVGIASVVLAGLLFGAAGGTTKAAGTTLYVSPTGSSHNADTSCQTAGYAVIQQAVNAASAGDTVFVCEGTYTFANQHGRQQRPLVLINKALTLVGQDAVLDASGPTAQSGAITDITAIASHVTIENFTVTGAVDEGILAEPPAAFLAGGGETPPSPVSPITDVTVTGNVVNGVDRGFVSPAGCVLPTEYFGDCGGGIHFNAVANSRMTNNAVSDNADGILITDDAGPNHGNLISHNTVFDNPIECGITLPSHNPHAVNVSVDAHGGFHVSGTNPNKGGVYDNLVENNVSRNNGTAGFNGNAAGSGAGVLMAAAGPGTGSYDNEIEANTLYGNGLAGVVIHGHYPGGVDVSGNEIVNNFIGANNGEGDVLDSPGTPTDMQTTGITILSASPITLQVSGNHISHDVYGIWHNLAATLQGTNSFSSVTTPVFAPVGPFGSAYCVPVIFLPQTCPSASGTATLHGYVDPNGVSTWYHFAYGTSPGALTSTTPTQSAGSGIGVVGALATISHLASNTTYYFELVTKNVHGTVKGLELQFTTT